MSAAVTLDPRSAAGKVRLKACLPGIVIYLMCAQPGLSQGQGANDPNLAHPNTVVTATRDGYTISALVTHLQGAAKFKNGIVLFPGAPGILRLHQHADPRRFELRGNFLVRTRRHWLDEDTLVVVVDAPSDQWTGFHQSFRSTPRYGADIRALLAQIAVRYNVAQWSFVGTSEGSVSAFHAARMNPDLARRAILTASLFRPTRNGPGLATANWAELQGDLLWVHHEHDPCVYTSYRDATEFAQTSRKPLLTVRGGGPGSGDACEPYTAHGFIGVEREVVLAIRSWIATGAVPPDFTP